VAKGPPADPGPEEPAPPAAAERPPASLEIAEPTELVVQRIVHDRTDPEASFAVISGRAVRAGDTIGGRQVLAVEPDLVRLDGDRVLPCRPSEKEE
jgi:hypothetical protein